MTNKLEKLITWSNGTNKKNKKINPTKKIFKSNLYFLKLLTLFSFVFFNMVEFYILIELLFIFHVNASDDFLGWIEAEMAVH